MHSVGLNSLPGAVALLACLALPVPATAELVSGMTAFVVVKDAAGQERLEPAARAEPGDVIEYRLEHTNTFDHPIGGVAIVGPVPEGLELTAAFAGTQIPATIELRGEFDPDRPGEEWAAPPVMRTVIDEDGRRRSEPAPKDAFTAIRWNLQQAMPARSTVRHAYRARLK